MISSPHNYAILPLANKEKSLTTPGTTQVCLFRDSYEPLTATGLAIYGLSSDSPKANTTFKEKQKLPYPLLCDPSAALISAIGLKKAPKGTTRGVFVVDKSGKVLAAEPGGPAATVEVVKRIVAELGGPAKAEAVAPALEAAAAAAPVEEAKAAEEEAEKPAKEKPAEEKGAPAPAEPEARAESEAPAPAPAAETEEKTDEKKTDDAPAPNGDAKAENAEAEKKDE